MLGVLVRSTQYNQACLLNFEDFYQKYTGRKNENNQARYMSFEENFFL